MGRSRRASPAHADAHAHAGAVALAPDNHPPMHLIVPFAGTVSEAGRLAQQTLVLPGLSRLLARLQAGPLLGSDELSLNAPHEQALARAWGWAGNGSDVCNAALPFAARRAVGLGLRDTAPSDPPAQPAWGLLTPVHLHAGSEQISLTDPASLQLDEAASRELLAIVQPLFDSEGFRLHWAAPLQWLATHPQFDGMATASLDRVIGRKVTPWLPDRHAARLVRRLQNEVQMLLYTHAVNDRREAAGLPTVNSFWLSGCGRLPAAPAPAPRTPTPAADLQIDDRLRAPALAEDWAAWCDAWHALDAGPISTLLQSGPGAMLTLCGERQAQTFAHQPQGWWQKIVAGWQRPAFHHFLDKL